jgi:hypothetical protein
MNSYWKVKRIYVCKSRMSLWIGLESIMEHLNNEKVSRHKLKKIITNFPETTNNCRCRNCRYHRLRKKYERNI